jgi:hypothetical protein
MTDHGLWVSVHCKFADMIAMQTVFILELDRAKLQALECQSRASFNEIRPALPHRPHRFAQHGAAAAVYLATNQ